MGRRVLRHVISRGRDGGRGHARVQKLGEFARADLVSVGEHHGAEHGILELAHVAGPRMRVEHRHASADTARMRLPSPRQSGPRKWPHQIRDILGAIAQRRHGDREDVQPIEQVLAEAAVLHVGDAVAVGRRDDAHVHLDGLPAPTGSTWPS
jgi:hypothetical protein